MMSKHIYVSLPKKCKFYLTKQKVQDKSPLPHNAPYVGEHVRDCGYSKYEQI